MKTQTTPSYSFVSLRKLTWKSVWDFTPKYQGMTLERVYQIKPSSLWWLYCKYEKISFVDEILETLETKFPLQRIQKPGIDPSQIDNYFSGFTYENKSVTELDKMIRAKRINGQTITPRLLEVYRDKKSERKSKDVDVNISKRTLQSVNHGNLHI